jgi:hypothetical protein
MKNSVIAVAALIALTSYSYGGDAMTTTPSLREIVDEIAAKGFAIVHNGNATVRLVRDQSQCALGEQLAPVWINFADVRQHLTGYACQAFID